MKTLSMGKIYTAEDMEAQLKRYGRAAERFTEIFGQKPTCFFSAPGRTEIGGNHTDHSLGRVLAASVSADTIAAVAPSEDGVITLCSEGFPDAAVDTADTKPRPEEQGCVTALIRGIAAGFKQKGYRVGGFKAYVTSNVPVGSGLSSSAAFEVLIGVILNGLYNGGDMSDVEIAKLGQYGENVYFGKPSGLMDQIASSAGGLMTIDFENRDEPVISPIKFDLADSEHCLCIVDTGGSHADLTGEYAAIPEEMRSVARYFGKEALREISKKQVEENLGALRESCGDRAALRALHFFDENERVLGEAEALKNKDFPEFLRLVNESGDSSLAYLQNIFAAANVRDQGLTLGLYLAKQTLAGEGACRVHGGGFGGTIQAFVPKDKLEVFRTETERVFGVGSCHELTIRSCGGTRVLFEVWI